MKQTLESSFGFPQSNIVVLVDQQATAKGILEAMDKLVADCRQDDIVVFHFSGHGSQMAAAGEKPSGYDESIMPYDSGRMNPTFPKQVPPCDIRDTDIQGWLFRLTQKTGHVTLIFDSCHSGSITRMQSDSEEEGTRLRWIAPDPLPADHSSVLKPTRSLSRDAQGDSGWLSLSEKYVLLAACAAEQGAYELDNEEMGRNGALTYFLTQELNQALESTYQDIWDIVAVKVNNRFQKQTPQLEGARDRRVFDVQDFTPIRYLLITHRQEDQVQLAGGAIHGVTLGSEWEIYPAGTKEILTIENSPQGIVKITAVETVAARGRIIEEAAPQTITQSARAVEVTRVDAERKMAVWLETPPTGYERSFEELREALAQSTLMRVTESAAGARALIRIAFSGRGMDCGNSAGPSWEVFDQSQARLLPSIPALPGAELRILEALETIWRYEKVLELRNEKSSLKGKVDFILLKKTPTGRWQGVAEREEPVYAEGDSIAFRVVNRSGIPLHVSVLDLGLSKRINLLYPSASASETLAPGRSGGAPTDVEASGTLSVGERPENEIELYYPESLSVPSSGPTAEPSRGKEIFKLCVTTRRHDLAFLRQTGLRTEPSERLLHPLERLLYLDQGGPTREARLKLAPQDEWFTIERSFWLERKVTNST